MGDVRKQTDFIVIHCSATKPSMNIDAKTIDRWHREKGYLKIGYHFVIKRDGVIEIGRQVDEVGAHAKGVNDRSVGICMIGGLNEEGKPAAEYTDAQWQSLRKLVGAMALKYSTAQIIGHRDVPGTNKACPSFDVQEWVRTSGSH